MKATTIAAVLLVAAVFATSALAGNSSSAGAYGSRGSHVQGAVQKPKQKKPTSQGATTLPFTGLDLAFVVGGGLLLVAMGVSLRRVTRRPPVS